MKSLSVIVPTKDRAGIVEESLRRLQVALQGVDAEVIIINDSATSTVNVPEGATQFKVYRNPGKGVASARNFGADTATAPLLFFMDDDMWIDANTVQRILELGRLYPTDAVNLNWEYPAELFEQIRRSAFGRFLNGRGFTSMRGWSQYAYWQDNAVFNCEGIAGACLVIHRDTYLGMGGYHSGFPLAGFEDYDFSARLKQSGAKLFIDTTVLIYHNEVNKTSIEGWLDRNEKSAVTRRYAVELGYDELRVDYPAYKRWVYGLITVTRPLFLLVIASLSHLPAADGLYARIANLLLGAAICKGYHSLPTHLCEDARAAALQRKA